MAPSSVIWSSGLSFRALTCLSRLLLVGLLEMLEAGQDALAAMEARVEARIEAKVEAKVEAKIIKHRQPCESIAPFTRACLTRVSHARVTQPTRS